VTSIGQLLAPQTRAKIADSARSSGLSPAWSIGRTIGQFWVRRSAWAGCLLPG